eukprot:jgi/Tetstr1/465040/TSEL_009768.t1
MSTDAGGSAGARPRIYISYSYFEREQSRKNLAFFLQHGVLGFDNVTVDLVAKGETCNVRVPEGARANVRVRRAENVGFDFGTHRENLMACNVENYDYFILMNCSCTGPFQRRGDAAPWYSRFTREIAGATKLVGSSIGSIIGPGAGYAGPLPYVAGVRHRSPGGWFMMTDGAGARALREELSKHDIKTFADAHAVENLTGKWMKDRGYAVAGLIPSLHARDRFRSVIVKTRYSEDPGVKVELRKY